MNWIVALRSALFHPNREGCIHIMKGAGELAVKGMNELRIRERRCIAGSDIIAMRGL